MDDLRKIESPGVYLDRARGLAGSQWGKATRKGAWGETALGRAAIRKLGEAETAELEEIVRANEAGFERNVENIGLRTTRCCVARPGPSPDAA